MPNVRNPFIIDLEASGFGPNSYPIEVGLAMKPGHRFSTLITPLPKWQHWDTGAETIHGLSRKNLLEYGKPVRWVAESLNLLLENEIVYSDGWVVDRPWLLTLFHAARVPLKFDMSPIERILSETQMDLWDAQKKQVIADLNIERHRASNDAWIVQETYNRCVR